MAEDVSILHEIDEALRADRVQAPGYPAQRYVEDRAYLQPQAATA